MRIFALALTDLRRWGLALTERGGKNARKRALIAVVSARPCRDRISKGVCFRRPVNLRKSAAGFSNGVHPHREEQLVDKIAHVQASGQFRIA